MTPLALPSLVRERHTSTNESGYDKRDDPGMRDEPQNDSNILLVPSAAGTMAKESILLGVELLWEDIDFVGVYDPISTDASQQSIDRACDTSTHPMATCSAHDNTYAQHCDTLPDTLSRCLQ